MDPVSQGVLGAVWAQGVARREQLRAATIAGIVGGMLPDMDVVIRSETDPLLFLEYHRHFTHSLVFIPVGGLIAALALWVVLRKWLEFRALWFFAAVGFATHGLLDACTSYGTYLLWPFSDMRVAWSAVSIIDPLFTVPLLIGAFQAWRNRRPPWALAAMAWGLAYLGLGFWQESRITAAVERIAEERGHEVERIAVHPSFANLILWRCTYQSEGEIHLNAVRLPFWSREMVVYPGGSIPWLDAANNGLALPEDSVIENDVRRFSHFSNDWLAVLPGTDPIFVGDMRYGLLPDQLDPLWGIVIDPSKPEEHVPYETRRSIEEGTWSRFGAMLRGVDPKSL